MEVLLLPDRSNSPNASIEVVWSTRMAWGVCWLFDYDNEIFLTNNGICSPNKTVQKFV